jgi:hypothetical protein
MLMSTNGDSRPKVGYGNIDRRNKLDQIEGRGYVVFFASMPG